MPRSSGTGPSAGEAENPASGSLAAADPSHYFPGLKPAAPLKPWPGRRTGRGGRSIAPERGLDRHPEGWDGRGPALAGHPLGGAGTRGAPGGDGGRPRTPCKPSTGQALVRLLARRPVLEPRAAPAASAPLSGSFAAAVPRLGRRTGARLAPRLGEAASPRGEASPARGVGGRLPRPAPRARREARRPRPVPHMHDSVTAGHDPRRAPQACEPNAVPLSGFGTTPPQKALTVPGAR
jgi:hypothetical protein